MISPERLAELRAMPYEEYLKTPEWLATRKRILIRDNHRCAGCHITGVSLTVHHYTHERLGCEDDNDLVSLCEVCHDQLIRTFLDLPHVSFLQKCGLGLGVAAIGTVGVEGFLQAPLPAELAVIIGAILLAKNSPRIYAKLKGVVPAEMLAWIGQAPKEGKRSTFDIWFGRGAKVVEGTTSRSTDNTESFEPVFPAYRDDETIRLGQAIDKKALTLLTAANQARKALPEVAGRRFDLHINSLFGQGVILAAAQGSGKSMLNGLIIEQAGACDSPAIIFDHKGEYPPIAELNYLSGLIVGGEMARRIATKIGAPYFALTPDNALEFVTTVFAKRHQAIIVLPSYGDSWLARAEIVAAVGKALMIYAARQRAEEKKLLPCLVFLDEAQLYIPQNSELLPPEARDKENKTVLNSLQNAFFALVSNGRSNGYTMCFATQSLTYIAKWAIKSCQVKILMRHVEHNDLNTCEEILGPKAIVRREDLETLPPGVGIVFNLTPKPMIVQFDKRESRDESETPGVERLREAKQPQPAAKVGDLTLQELKTMLSQTSNNDPDTDVLSNSYPDTSSSTISLGQDMSISRELFDVAIRMRKSGTSTGFRDLMNTFALSEHYARRLNKLLDDESKEVQ